MIGRLSGFLLVLAALAPAMAAPPDAAPASSPPEAPPAFRRIFIPRDAVNSRTWKEGYLPVDAQEFERLLKSAHDDARGAPREDSARLEQADYTAELVGDDMLVGTAALQLAALGKSPMMLSLSPCSLTLESTEWTAPNAKPAVLGTNRTGQLSLLIEGSELRTRWSQRGERTASGNMSFQLSLPTCSRQKLVLETRVGLDVLADRGLVSKSAGATPETNRWLIEPGSYDRITVRVIPEDSNRERRPLTLLRQSLTYEFSSRGIALDAQLRLDVHGEPLVRAAIELDPELHLVAVRYGQTAVPWSTTTDEKTKRTQALLEFPEPIVGTGRVLQLKAVAPLTMGKRWRLPGIQPQNMAWQEGTSVLLIPDALVLEQLLTDGCRQSRVTALPAPLAGESIEVQYYRPNATIDVLLAEPRRRLAVDSASLVEVSPNEVTSRVTLLMNQSAGRSRRLQIPIQTTWTVDAVENLDLKTPVEWEIDEVPGQAGHIKFTLNGSARVLVRGHRPSPGASAFEGRTLQMLDLASFDGGARLIQVRPAEGSELRWTDTEELNRQDVVGLSPERLKLFSQAPAGFVLIEDANFEQASVMLERRKPSYAADIHIDAAVQNDSLAETYRIQCVPDAARVERLLVQFSHPRDRALEWSLAGGNSGQFSARKLSAGEQAKAGLPAGGEVWELLLRLTRSGPFELRAQRTSPFVGETPLALVSITDATSQRGTLAIRALGESGLSIKNRRLMSVPAELLGPDRYQTARATYHYQPSRDDLGAEPAVSLAPAPRQSPDTGAWVWLSELESRFAIDGTAVHQATLRLQTAGRHQFRLQLPEGAKPLAAFINAQRLALTSPAPKSPPSTGILVELPPGRAQATVSLEFSTVASLPRLVARALPPFPTLENVPVARHQWRVLLPPGFEVADVDSRTVCDEIPRTTWSQRLFGPLGRTPQNKVFNPLDAEQWRTSLAFRGTSEAAFAEAEQFLQTIGTIAGESLEGEELTWGQLLSTVSDTEAQAGSAVRIDTDGLASVGVTPQTPLRVPTAGSPVARGKALLQQANLVVIAQPGGLLLAARSTAASYACQLSAARREVLFASSPGFLSDELQNGVTGLGWSRFAPVELWRVDAPRELASGADSSGEPLGWHAATLQWSDADTSGIRIVQTATMRSLAWGVFLATLAIGFWKRVGQPWLLLALATVAAAVALVVPSAYAALCSATLLACLMCLAVRIAHFEPVRPRTTDRSGSAISSRSSIAQRIAPLLLLAAIVHCASALDAAPPDSPAQVAPSDAPKLAAPGKAAADTLPTSPTPSTNAPPNGPSTGSKASAPATEPTPATMYQVFVPTDEEQSPAGGKYFVPEKMVEDLHRRAATHDGRPKQWLITKAAYQGSLSRDPVSSQIGVSGLKARFELHVFQSQTPVRIPLAREAWITVILGARLDGRIIPLTWNTTGDELVLGPLPAETYRLELDLKPTLLSDTASSGFELPIPPISQATLDLTLPTDSPPIEVAGNRGQLRLDSKRGELHVQLGATNRLSLRWPRGGLLTTAAANLEAEELIWVKVRPGTTVLDARFKYRVVAGRVRQIRLLTDPRLRLLSAPKSSSPITAVHTIPGDPQRIHLELGRDVTGEVVVEMSFLVTGTSGVGILGLPRLESSDAKATRRWLGVTVDPALQPKIQAGEDTKSLDVAEFMAAWGAGEARPQLAYSIPRGEPIWRLATQPGEPQTAVEQTLSVSLGRTANLVRLDAQLTITAGVFAQIALQAPPGIVVEQISVLEETIERVARWSVDPEGRISIFLIAPINGKQKLTLRGRLKPPPGNDYQVPQLAMLGAERKKSRLLLYRQPTVLVEVERAPNAPTLDATTSDSPTDIPPAGFGALAGEFALDASTAPIRVKLSPNTPRVQATAVTYLDRENDRWIAEVDEHIEVTQGLADTLQFEIPPQWSEPLTVVPEMQSKIVSMPGEQRRQLILYPPKAISGKQRVQIRGRVALSPGDRLGVPDVLPLRVQQLERFVVLPQTLDAQHVTWDTLGLSRTDLPQGIAPAGAKARAGVSYRVAGERFQASLKAVQRASATAQVKLADIYLMWQPDNRYQGVATFDLDPGGSTHCVLELPEGSTLLRVTVERLSALVTQLAPQRWRLNLGPQQLPQRIEVTYLAAAEASGSTRRFEAPRLADLKVEQTLWTIFGPPRAGAPLPGSAPELTSPIEQQLVRLTATAELVQLSTEVVAEHLPEEIVRWYGPWQQRYSTARSTLRRELTAARRSSTQAEEDVEARQLDKKMAAIDQRLGVTRAPLRDAPSVDGPAQLMAVAGPGMRPLHFAVRGRGNSLEIGYSQPIADGVAGRWLLALTILLGGSALAYSLRSRRLPSLSPWLVAAALGFAWWLLLAPSVIGFLLLIAAAAAGLRSRWKSAPIPFSRSTAA